MEVLQTGASQIEASVAKTVAAACALLTTGFDAVLLDISSSTVVSVPSLAATIAMIHDASPRTAVVVLAGTDRVGVALISLLHGADEVAHKHPDATPLLGQVLMRASERQRLHNVALPLLVGLTHDLNGVFQTIGLACKLISKGDEDDRRSTFAARALRANHRGVLLIDDLADLTRGAFAGTLPLSLARADLGRVATAAAAAASASHPDRAISAEGPRCDAMMDERRVSRLLSIALDTLVRRTQPDSILELVVSADATTVAVEIRATRFGADLWDRASVARSLIQTIVRAHGGTLDLASAAGSGAVMAVRLPRGPPPALHSPRPDTWRTT